MGTPPLMVDILPEISGVDFDTAWSRRVESPADADSGVIAPFISAEDLLVAKLATGRSQDLADVAAIRTAQKPPEQPRTAKSRRRPQKPAPKP